MNSFGKVIEVNGDFVKISTLRNSACGDCHGCSTSEDVTEAFINAKNEHEARIGDTVEYDMPTSSILKAAFIAYTVPLIVMVLTMYISQKVLPVFGIIDNLELYSALIGIFSMASVFIVIRLNEKRFSKNNSFVAKTTRIVVRKERGVF